MCIRDSIQPCAARCRGRRTRWPGAADHAARNRGRPLHPRCRLGQMKSRRSLRTMHRSRLRLVAMCAVGAVAAILTVIFTAWTYAPVVGWAAASLTYITWVWLVIWRLDAQQTALHAVREDPSRAISDVLVLIASLGSLGAVAIILVEARSAPAARGGVLAGLAVASVVLSWLLLHTLFTLRYASLYYRDEGGRRRFQPAGTAAIQRLRISRFYDWHDLPGVGYER